MKRLGEIRLLKNLQELYKVNEEGSLKMDKHGIFRDVSIARGEKKFNG